MYATMQGQALLLLNTFIIGLFLGFLYEFIRIFRKYIKHNTIAVQIEDILYWLAISFLVFLATLKLSDGKIRPYYALGLFLGLLVYRNFVSAEIFYFLTLFIDKIIFLLKAIIKIILFPFIMIYSIAKYPFYLYKIKMKRSKSKVKNRKKAIKRKFAKIKQDLILKTKKK